MTSHHAERCSRSRAITLNLCQYISVTGGLSLQRKQQPCEKQADCGASEELYYNAKRWMLAGEALRIGLGRHFAFEELVDLPVGNDVVLLLQAIHRDGHGEPDGIEHDKRGRPCEVPLAHAREPRRLLPRKREAEQEEEGQSREGQHPD